MLAPENNREMLGFAIQSLDQMIEEGIRKIMSNSDLFMKVFSLTEYHGSQSFSFDIQ